MINNTMNQQEIAEEKRKRQMAIIKASNQMLTEALEKSMNNTTDPVKRAELKQRFDTAIEQNKAMAKSYLHASEEEVENSTYREKQGI